jgi:hypothetical protein
MTMVSRQSASIQSAALLRLEGLSSSPEVDELMDAWVAGEASDADLIEAERRILAGRSVPAAHAA